jgi:hypothetical protein
MAVRLQYFNRLWFDPLIFSETRCDPKPQGVPVHALIGHANKSFAKVSNREEPIAARLVGKELNHSDR